MLRTAIIRDTSIQVGERAKLMVELDLLQPLDVPEKLSRFPGELEIDYNRGVVYFHVTDEAMAEELGAQTLLRVQGLSVPVRLPVDVRP